MNLEDWLNGDIMSEWPSVRHYISYSCWSELLNETFIDSIAGFGSLDNGLSEEKCKEICIGITEEGSEALKEVSERMCSLLMERIKHVATTGVTGE